MFDNCCHLTFIKHSKHSNVTSCFFFNIAINITIFSNHNQDHFNNSVQKAALPEEIAYPTVYHQFSQLFVDIELTGLLKFREDLGVLVDTMAKCPPPTRISALLQNGHLNSAQEGTVLRTIKWCPKGILVLSIFHSVGCTLSEAIGSLSRRRNSSDGSVLIRRLTEV